MKISRRASSGNGKKSILLTMSMIVLIHSLDGASAKTTTTEYCIEEKLEIQCAADEIVVIETARYGRMRLNRCVRTDYGYIGCGTDVTSTLASRCSGRRQCRIVNLETLFASSIVCPPDLKPFLEASYSCVKVVVPTSAPGRSRCIGRQPAITPGVGYSAWSHTVTETRGSSGVLASLTTYELGVGTASCPWLIVGVRGQRINLTLMDFTDYQYNPNGIRTIPLTGGTGDKRPTAVGGDRVRRRSSDTHQGPRYCREYATVTEEGDGAPVGIRNLVMCSSSGSNKRSPPSVVYTSTTHRVRVTFITSEGLTMTEGQPQEGPYFALRYDVFGCPYPMLPSNAHIDFGASGAELMRVQCNGSSDWWTLQCIGSTWTGTTGNCSDNEALLVTTDIESYLPYGISLLVIIVVALFICMLTLAIGLAYMQRNRSSSSARSRSTLGSKHRQLMTSSSTYALAPNTCTLIQQYPDSSDVVMTTKTMTPRTPPQSMSPVKSSTLPTRLGPHAVGLPPSGTVVSGVAQSTGPGSCSSPTQRRVMQVNFSPRTTPRCPDHGRRIFDGDTTPDDSRLVTDLELAETWHELQQQHRQHQQQQQQQQLHGGCCCCTPVNNVVGGPDHSRKCTCTGGVEHSVVPSSPVFQVRHQQCLHPTAILDIPPPPPPPTLPKPPTTLLFSTFKPATPVDGWDDNDVNMSAADDWNRSGRPPTGKMRTNK